jgi:hypothetical protein
MKANRSRAGGYVRTPRTHRLPVASLALFRNHRGRAVASNDGTGLVARATWRRRIDELGTQAARATQRRQRGRRRQRRALHNLRRARRRRTADRSTSAHSPRAQTNGKLSYRLHSATTRDDPYYAPSSSRGSSSTNRHGAPSSRASSMSSPYTTLRLRAGPSDEDGLEPWKAVYQQAHGTDEDLGGFLSLDLPTGGRTVSIPPAQARPTTSRPTGSGWSSARRRRASLRRRGRRRGAWTGW